MLGLVEAVERFDPDRGSLLAFATPTMVGHIKRYFRDHGWFVRPPTIDAGTTQRSRPGQERSDLPAAPTPEYRRDPSHLGLSAGDVHEAGHIQDCLHPTSLDAPIAQDSDSGPSYSEVLGNDEPELDRIDVIATIKPACQQLPADDRRILYLRFFLLYTQDEIGAELGISQMQVSRRLRRIFTQLKAVIGELDPPPAAAIGPTVRDGRHAPSKAAARPTATA